MQPQKQVMRFSDAELQIIKNTFSDNDVLGFAIRKVFLQIPLTDTESSIVISTFKNKPELEAVVRKAYLPEIDPYAPIYQVIDLWMTVEIKDKHPELAFAHLQSRDILIKYLRQQLDVLFGKRTKKGIDFASLSDITDKLPQEAYVDMLTRNTIIGHIEQQIGQLALLAGQSAETVEQTKSRLSKNSAK